MLRMTLIPPSTHTSGEKGNRQVSVNSKAKPTVGVGRHERVESSDRLVPCPAPARSLGQLARNSATVNSDSQSAITAFPVRQRCSISCTTSGTFPITRLEHTLRLEANPKARLSPS